VHLFKRVKFACVEGDIKKYKGTGTDYVSQNEDLAHVAKNAYNIGSRSRGLLCPKAEILAFLHLHVFLEFHERDSRSIGSLQPSRENTTKHEFIHLVFRNRIRIL
jgi:hypothetical protein